MSPFTFDADSDELGPGQRNVAIVEVVRELIELAALERIADEIYPYWPDDPATSSFPDDGRVEVEP